MGRAQPCSLAKCLTNPQTLGIDDMSKSVSSRGRRAPASSSKIVNRMAVTPPAARPLVKRPPANQDKYSGARSPNWQPTPIQNERPTTSAWRWSRPSETTILIPTTNRMAMMTMTYVESTAPGRARTSAVNLGRKAKMTRAAPTARPTRRALTLVIWANETVDERVACRSVPPRAASRFAAASAATAPCTERKSVARCVRHDTY